LKVEYLYSITKGYIVMSLNYAYSGANSVPEYLVSAIPWVTASVVSGLVQYTFPQVSMFIIVKNISGANIKVGFTQNGVNGTNYFSLAQSEAFSGDFRTTSLFVSGSGNSVNVVAGMTMIQTRNFPTLTASNGFQGVG
jgi:hypothetical protein